MELIVCSFGKAGNRCGPKGLGGHPNQAGQSGRRRVSGDGTELPGLEPAVPTQTRERNKYDRARGYAGT